MAAVEPPPGFMDDAVQPPPPGFFDDDGVVGGIAGDGEDAPVDAEVLQRRRDWLKLNKQRHNVREEHKAATGVKAPLPPEYLRKIIRDHGDMSHPKFRDHRRLYIGALRFMPHAVMKLMENIPMPWEQAKFVDVVYHTAGAITIVNDTPKCIEAHFRAQWAAMWTAQRREKRVRGPTFHRVLESEMTFGDEEKPLDFGVHLMDLVPPPAIALELDEEEDATVFDWFYDMRDAPTGTVLRPSRPRFRLPVQAMATLLRLAAPLLPDSPTERDAFLWTLRDFYSAKALNVALPGGPKFQLPKNELQDQAAADDEWTEFTDLGKVIVRQPITTETQLSHPWLYATRPENGVKLRSYRTQQLSITEPLDGPEDVPVFHFAASYNPIRDVLDAPHVEEDDWSEDDDDDDSNGAAPMPDSFVAFGNHIPLQPEAGTSTAPLRQGIDLLFAPPPFNKLVGPLRRPVDIPLVDSWYNQGRSPSSAAQQTRSSYQRLLKGYVKRKLHNGRVANAQLRQVREAAAGGGDNENDDENDDAAPAVARRHNRSADATRIIDDLSQTKFFQKTNIEWLEAGMQLVFQGHTMLTLLLRMRNMQMLHLNFNFDIKATKQLSTKERKRTRLGQAFHLVRTLLKMTKIVVDLHVKYRLGKIDAHQLADALHFTFTNMAKLTEVHKYKYRAMRTAQQATDLKHLILSKFNTGDVQEGPGEGFWLPSWRVWMFFLRGMTPLLQGYLSNLLNRLFEGRKNKGDAKRLTKQRVDSNFDLNLKAALQQAFIEALPEGYRAGGKARVLESHAAEAFRCWRQNTPWVVKNMPEAIEQLIRKYVKEKADNYVRQTYYNRERIVKGDVVDKGLYMKNLGRITRLKLRDEQDRQARYLASGPQFSTQEAVAIYKMLARWLESRNFTRIEFPKSGLQNEKELLSRTLDRLRSQHNVGNRLTQEQREEQKRIEDAYDSPQSALNRIRMRLARDRIFKPVKAEFMDGYTLLAPVYTVDPVDKMVDAFLDSYLWYEASRKRLFPSWVKPSDAEPGPKLAFQFCEAINNSPHVWDTAGGEATVLMQAQIEELHEKVDWSLMKSLLGLVMDPILVAYICARHDVKVEYKDMTYDHHVGLLRGYQFASFLAQFWGFINDLLLLGPQRAAQLAGPPNRPNGLCAFSDPHEATAHPIRGYLRYLDRVYILLRYSRGEADELVERFFENDKDPANLTVAGYKNKTCWPRDARMRLLQGDVNLGRSVLWDFRTRLPPGMGSITWDNSFVSVYSEVNPNLLLDLCGFELRIVPSARLAGPPPEIPNLWNLRDRQTRETSARAWVQVTAEHVVRIKNKIRRCILSIGNSPFHKIAIKWNSLLMELIPYYREAILGTDGLQLEFQRGETRVQTRIKMMLNSKNPERFPPVVFYTPTELGGLGMLSVGASLIPAQDVRLSKLTSDAPTEHFLKGMTHQADGDIPVPNVMNSYPAWHREFVDSAHAWSEYEARHRDATRSNRRITFDEVEDLLDQGIPRVRTLFNKDRRILEHDRGWRVRQEFMQFQYGRFLTRWWYSEDHDGRLCAPLDDYKQTVIQALGGVESILEHTLFAGTGFTSWEGLFWDKKGSLEDRIKDEKLTKAMRAGLTKVPNQRFALWWSPTINRSSVYAGFENQLDRTGIVLTGKLELIKTMYVKILPENLWAKIHRNIVDDLMATLNTIEYRNLMHLLEVRLEQVHSAKSLERKTSQPDASLISVARWPVAKPSHLEFAGDVFDQHTTTATYWFDIQLTWGNFDKHSMPQHCRERFVQINKNSAAAYPSKCGVVIAFDLAYSQFGAYGYWIPELKGFLQRALVQVNRKNASLETLRRNIQKELQLYKSDPTEMPLSSQNFDELFGSLRTWLIHEASVFTTDTQRTAMGNVTNASKNGVLFIVDPKTGQLFLSVIHKSALAGQSRRKKLGFQKAADEILSWLKPLPEAEHPHKIILTRQGAVFGAISSALLDFPSIGLGRTDLVMPINELLKNSQIADLVTTATESKAVRFNLFDDWPTVHTPNTCFLRLLLILRGLHVNVDRTKFLLQPDRHTVIEPGYLWPKHSVEEWIDIEAQLRDMIIADYARRLQIQPTQLTETEVRHIMLGKKVTSADVQQDEIKAVEEKAKKTIVGGQTVKTINKRGEEITVRQTRVFEVGAFNSSTSWRERAAATSAIGNRVSTIYAADIQLAADAQMSIDDLDMLVFPKTMLQRFLRCADPSVAIAAICYGFAVPDHPEAREVRCLVMPPQLGKMGAVDMPSRLPSDDLITSQRLVPVGIIRTQGGGEPVATTADLTLLGKLLAANDTLTPQTFAVVNVSIGGSDVTVSATSLTDEGISWAMEHASAPSAVTPSPADPSHVAPSRIRVSDRIEGFTLVPSLGGWNYHFRQPDFSKPYKLKADVPRDFFHASHRPLQYLGFAAELGEASEYDVAGLGGDFDSAFS